MKRLTLILSIFGMLVYLIPEVKAAEPYQKKYPFKSAIIHYEIKGEVQSGTEELYIQGVKSCSIKHITIKVLNNIQKQDLMVIDDGENVYSIDLNEKTGTKMVSPYKMTQELTPEEREKLEETGLALVKGISGKLNHEPIGTENILGKPCKIYKIFGVKSWQWEGVPLKTEMQMMGKITQTATKIDVNKAISDSRFKVPAGIKVRDISNEQKNLFETNFLEGIK